MSQSLSSAIKVPQEIIVVEGKNDTQKLQHVFGPQIKTIETRGLRLDREFFAFLNQLNNQDGLIIFTDPDAAGQKIRQRLLSVIERPVKQAFIDKAAFPKEYKKKGVAEASKTMIHEALDNLITFDLEQNCLLWSEYLELGLNDKQKRDRLAKKLRWPLSLTNKTFFKWLNWSRQNLIKINQLMEENDE